MSHIEHLRRIPLLRSLDDDDLGRIGKAAREETFEAGKAIVEFGEPGRALHILVEGSVQVLYPGRSAELELARLGPGDFFGEMALLNEQPRSATVRAIEPSRTLVLDRDEFREMMAEFPAIALRVLEVLSLRIRTTDERMSGLSERAMRDPLTGLLNRRAFHERLMDERDRAQRYGYTFSLILLDVDHFRGVNETLGYDAGDAALTWIGRLLTEHTRAADSPFRVGGEEFAVLAPATAGAVARSLAERIVRTIGEEKPPLPGDVQLTVSAGYACCPMHGGRSEELFNVADQALFRAKREGRNRVGDPDTGDPAPSPAPPVSDPR